MFHIADRVLNLPSKVGGMLGQNHIAPSGGQSRPRGLILLKL